MLSKGHTFLLSLAILVSIPFLSIPSQSFGTDYDQGIRLDLPLTGRVRIDNPFGAVVAKVWEEKYVLVSADITKTQDTLSRSPVIVDNRSKLLSISIVSRPPDPIPIVDLLVRIPDSTHLEITTRAGSITLRGTPVSASLESASGEVRTELSTPVNATVFAKSTTGAIRSNLASATSDDGHLLQAKFGAASRMVRINTSSGAINLAELVTTDQITRSEPEPPQLAGSVDSSRSAGTPANPAENEEVSEGDVVRVDSQLVTLNMNVIDRNTNRGLAGLIQTEFRMFEDGVEQSILQFDASSAPFDLVLLVDLSGSTKDVLQLIRAAALRFIEAARPSDRIAVITFAGQPALVSSLTLDRNQLRKRVNSIQTAPGGTNLYDATEFAINEISKERTKSRRTAIVLMSDGLDGSVPGVHSQQGSKVTYNELLSQVREFDGVFYTLWLNTYYEAMNPQDTQPEAFDVGHDRMKEIADSGGGIFYEVERLEDLAGAYEKVVADLGTVYSLAYRPANKARDGKWRAIRVSVNRPNAVARGKRGYYAN